MWKGNLNTGLILGVKLTDYRAQFSSAILKEKDYDV